ncbi:DUF421 domain-containing protein [Pseudosporangium ferrugineum]|uniref:Uncharacterized protein DUF421 n=1 Tax=Pseudosporangium ferrugineum TaxID=439699 RepID=A0A2T0RG06_9ACTN|nr:YetF domain-containing protein [Pseudosporangium ferrugineum]PRY20136.1 uncharacterized protein DUF421 [Pseudosporangium ferrugineum]
MRWGLGWWDAVTVVGSTIGLYVAFLIMLRIVGQRAFAMMSSFDLAATVAFGAVMGRAVLGYTPTLTAGLLGMGTLLILQALFGAVRRNRRVAAAITNQPILLMADGAVLHDHLRVTHMVEDELRQQLRLAGIHRYDEVTAVILERTGSVSVLRRGETIAPELLSDVRGSDLLAARHVRP